MRRAPKAPDGTGSPRTTLPAAIGSAFVSSVAIPATVSARRLLVAELQEEGAERVADHDPDGKGGPDASLGGDLDRDVADREEQPAGDAVGHSAPPEAAAERQRDDRRGRRRAEPEQDLARRAARALAAAADQRDGEREQPEHRDPHACELGSPELPVAHPGRDEGEDPDPARGHALDERERRQRQRGDVERKAGALEREAEQPAAVGEQHVHRVQRPPKRKRGQRGRGVVLAEVGDVRQRRGRQREDERDSGLGAHGSRIACPS